jgi:hypothetical protein
VEYGCGKVEVCGCNYGVLHLTTRLSKAENFKSNMSGSAAKTFFSQDRGEEVKREKEREIHSILEQIILQQ